MFCLKRFVRATSFLTIGTLLVCLGEVRMASAAPSESATRSPASAAGESAAAILVRVQELVKKGQAEAALKKIDGEWGAALKGATGEAAKRLARGRVLEALNRKEQAAAEYEKGLDKKGALDTHLQYMLGGLRLELGQYQQSRDAFASVLRAPKADLPRAMQIRSILAMAQATARQASSLSSTQGKAVKTEARNSSRLWREVVQQLQPHVKKARGLDIYPSYIYLLLKAKRHQGTSDCRLARELFAKYPAAEEVKTWGPLMPNNRLEDKKLACSATAKDIQERLRRLQLAGRPDRALQEIAEMRSRAVFETWTLDAFEINAMLAQGRNEEAMKLLLKHAETSRGRPQFWNMFGRITSRLGDFTASSSAYYKAYELAPRGRAASDALFNSAFASYQMQDYDGAEKTFTMLSTRYGKAKVARDSRWHLAWMSYLRGDFETALERWQGLLKERSGRRAARGDATSPDRIKYWSAMALLRLGKEKEAVETLRDLMRDPSIDYYAVLAWYRLKSIPGVKLQEVEQRLGFRQAVSEQVLQESAAQIVEDVKAEEVAEAIAAEDSSGDDAGDAESGAIADAGSDGAGENGDVATADANSADGSSGGIEDSNSAGGANGKLKVLEPTEGVRDPALQKRLDRVRLLYAIGMNEETRWELQNLESLVRNSQDRRIMMNELHRMGRWDRSSVLGELTFSGPRLRGGLDGARDLWEFAYPKAWPDFVVSSAKAASVPEELVWSIMRAESQYRAEARSPVGAMGLMQIMPFTGERVAKDLLGRGAFQSGDLQDPEINVKFGARYLQRLVEKFSGSVPLVAAGYNAGPHRVQNWLKGFGALRMDEFIEHIPFVETRNYVKKVSRNFQIYRLLYRDDRGSLDWLVKPVGVAPDSGPNALEVW